MMEQVCLEVIPVHVKKVFASFNWGKSCLVIGIAFCNEITIFAVSLYLREDYQEDGGAQQEGALYWGAQWENEG